MVRRGMSYRERYINHDVSGKSFLNPAFDPEEVYIRSTQSRRTIESAQSVMFGMFSDSPNFKKGDERSSKIVIHTREKSEENMYPRKNSPELKKLRQDIKSSKEFIEAEKKIKESLLSELDDPDMIQRVQRGGWIGMENTLHSMERHEAPIPNTLSKTARETLYRASGWYASMMHGSQKAISLGVGSFIGDFLGIMKDKSESIRKEKNNKTNFAYFSGHDNTLFPILSGIQIFDGHHPPMGSHLEIEMYKKRGKSKENLKEEKREGNMREDLWVRLVYNNEEVSIPACQSQSKSFRREELFPPLDKKGNAPTLELCPFDRFQKILEDFVPQEKK
eukprot:TRINITY_DN7182_c0_g2_i1.p1 TRINITY_DN7182_c0_g2~~TRINITY_DN7182_c0_g2_i1.p1  ORF type:complete len:334 (-),score=74.05 TRINITY_DN7182_c0_g2_i1:8-1009(-)